MTQPWLNEAWKMVGQAEVGGKGANPEIIRMFADAGVPEITSDETHWCAAFVSACLARAGIEPPKRYDALRARAFEKFGTELREPRVGCIAVFARTDNPAFGHVGFVTGITEDYLFILGGNQRNMVNVSPYPRARLTPRGLRWPAPPKTRDQVAETSVIAGEARAIEKDAVKLAATQAVVQTPLQAGPKVDDAAIWFGEMGAFQTAAEGTANFMKFASANWWLVLALGGAFFGVRMLRRARAISDRRTADENEGRHDSGGAAA